MSKKRNVKDSELEKLNGGSGVMDPPNVELAEVEGLPDDAKFDTHQVDLGNDMIRNDTARE
jgi:hypothetical protein